VKDIKERIVKATKKHLVGVAQKTAEYMRRASNDLVDPEVRELDLDKDGHDGAEVVINKPNEMQEAERLNLLDKAFGRAKGWIQH